MFRAFVQVNVSRLGSVAYARGLLLLFTSCEWKTLFAGEPHDLLMIGYIYPSRSFKYV